MQRDLWRARTSRLAVAVDRPVTNPGRGSALASGLRVRVGRGLIGIGSWLSGEPVAPVRRSAHGRAA